MVSYGQLLHGGGGKGACSWVIALNSGIGGEADLHHCKPGGVGKEQGSRELHAFQYYSCWNPMFTITTTALFWLTLTLPFPHAAICSCSSALCKHDVPGSKRLASSVHTYYEALPTFEGTRDAFTLLNGIQTSH